MDKDSVTKLVTERTATMYDTSILNDIISYENGDMDENKEVKLFQYLLDSGMVWKLQGSYGRKAASMIKSGLINVKKPPGSTEEMCYYCTQSKHIFHKVENEEHHEQAIFNTDPCVECKAKMELGILVVAVTDDSHDDDPNPHRTGDMAVISEQFVRQAFRHDESEEVLSIRAMFLGETDFNRMVADISAGIAGKFLSHPTEKEQDDPS